MKFVMLKVQHEGAFIEKVQYFFCKGCKKEVEEEWRFCPWCSHKFMKRKTPQEINMHWTQCTSEEDTVRKIKKQIEW